MWSARLLLLSFICSAFGASEWEAAYHNAYPAKDISKQASRKAPVSSLAALNEETFPKLFEFEVSPSMMGVDYVGISTTLFDIGMCMLNPTDFIENARDGIACGTGTYSCMSFWGNEINFWMLIRQWCVFKYFLKLPSSSYAVITAPYRQFLHSVLATSWNYMMLAVSPAKVKGVDLITGGAKTSGMSFVETEKEKCEAMLSLPDQVQCMMQKFKEVAHVKVNHSALPRETFEVMRSVYRDHKKDVNLLQKDGLSALRKSINDPIPLGYIQIQNEAPNPAPSPANPPQFPSVAPFVADTGYPQGRPTIDKSIGYGMFGLASPNRYAWITPGLRMSTKITLTSLIDDAKSNDGSSGVLYVDSASSSKFHFYMPGGYFCYNQEMCFERCNAAPMLCSTKGWEESVAFSGIFSPEEGGLEGWTHGVVSYTTSDAFLGKAFVPEFAMVAGTMQAGTLGSYFKGVSLVSAVLKYFVDKGLGATSSSAIVISGCSAAAIGLAPLDDMISGILAGFGVAFAPEVTVVADSAPITNGPAPINGQMPLPQQSQALAYMIYIVPGIDTGLKATYPACYSKFAELCVWSPYVYPYQKTPIVIMHNMWDSFALGNQANSGGGFLNATTYVWGLKLVAEENYVMSLATKVQNMFGLNCYDHCYVENPWWWLYAPATAKTPYWEWSARTTLLASLAGDRQNIVIDELVQFDSGCIGQSLTQGLYGALQAQSGVKAQVMGAFGFGVPQGATVEVSAGPLGNPNSATGSLYAPV